MTIKISWTETKNVMELEIWENWTFRRTDLPLFSRPSGAENAQNSPQNGANLLINNRLGHSFCFLALTSIFAPTFN